MAWKFVSMVLIFLFLFFSFAFLFQNFYIGGPAVDLKVNYLEEDNIGFVDYGSVPVFASNLRFNHNLISYYVEDECDGGRRENMVAAFNIFSEKVDVVSFYEGGSSSDIKVVCSDQFIDLGGDLYAAGEGGPSRIVNTSGFKIIEEGRIILYNSDDCDYPVVELHELGHVFGFDHSRDPKNIMFNTSSCGQRISEDMVDLMRKLYSVEALPDAKIENVTGRIHGRYLDFNITVLNQGLVDIESLDLTIFTDGKEGDSFDLGRVDVGFGRTLKVNNLAIPIGTEEVKFVLDDRGLVRELDEGNNVVVMG